MNKVLLCVSLCLLFSFNVSAAKQEKPVKKVDIKCHIELYGGQETFYLAVIRNKALKKFSEKLINRKILTVFSNEKKQVYKVFECVKMTDTFSTLAARNLFAKFPR